MPFRPERGRVDGAGQAAAQPECVTEHSGVLGRKKYQRA